LPRLPIDVDYLIARLTDLLAVPSPTGYTDEIVRLCSKEIKKLGLEVDVTRRGAIRAVRQGGYRRGARAIISHLDTLGAQVKALKQNGRLSLVPIGNWSSRFAEGGRVTIFSEKGAYRGTVLPLKSSGHTFNQEIDTQPVSWDNVEIRVDAMSRNDADLVKLGIAVGDIVAFDTQSEFLDNGFIVSRHLDNKAGVAIMLAAIEALNRENATTPVDIHWLFTIAEEVGVGASSVLTPDIASIVTVDNGTTAPGQNSAEFGVTIGMADETGPFDWHLTRKLVELCRQYDIHFQKDIFRFYRSDSAAALEAGHDVRSALVTFGVDSSHGYERIHVHALRSVAELITVYVTSQVGIPRDAQETSDLKGFTHQPMKEADQSLDEEGGAFES
jgi:peptidase M42 family hydrolase